MDKQLELALARVQKPGRYVGGELNSVHKDREKVDVRFAFCFPDTYEIGMSHLGMKILYGKLNERPDVWCERAFAPWVDMESEMRARGIGLYALESGDPLCAFDFIGFTLQYELCYTNLLNMLDLSGLPLRAADRGEKMPIVIAGGPCVCNPEPMAAFVDLFCLGESEEQIGEVVDLYKQCKREGKSKKAYLEAAAQIGGVYVPSLYSVRYNDDGTVAEIEPKGEKTPAVVRKRIIRDLDSVYYPEKFVIPSIEVVHDRPSLEVFRGCIRGCRFCQAGFIYRPVREKKPETLCRDAKAICEATGCDELSLASLSTSDYTALQPLIRELLDWTAKRRISLSLPSLRIDNFPEELAKEISSVRKSGLTFAPEAGTQRLRDVINKNITEEEILETCKKAFRNGWTSVKLYFMLGLPFETDEDVEGIAGLAQKIVDIYYSMSDRPKGKSVRISVSTAVFVPKPFTPFQWEPQDTRAQVVEKQKKLLAANHSRKVGVSYHESRTSLLEAALARGDRRLSDVVEAAYRAGCRLDGWDECFDFDKWLSAFDSCGLDIAFYANRRRAFDEVLPWSHLDFGVSREFLEKECRKAAEAATTPDCRTRCSGCGANRLIGGKCFEHDARAL